MIARNSQIRDYQNTTQPGACEIPSWINSELIEDTIRVWQPYYPQELTDNDAVEILQNVGQFFDVMEDRL